MGEVTRSVARTYGEVLGVERLLALQDPISPAAHHDELQYVIIHQCSELWFKLLLHELDWACAHLLAGDLRAVAPTLRRCTRVVQVLDAGFGLMETMTARDYAAFRPSLSGGSGFQSAQFREAEIALGCHRLETVRQAAFTEAENARIARRLAQPDLWHCFVQALRAAGYAVSSRQEAAADPARYEQGLRELVAMYMGEDPTPLREISEEMTALDNAVQLWRTHHAAMAERAIGQKVGTGGEGVEYLYRTARSRCFPELSAMRTLI